MGLYVGHSAYAQVLVLAVYLGGMAIGALIVADLSKRVARPLAWYVGAEVALAALGLLFHPAFVLTTGLSYDVVFPALGSRIARRRCSVGNRRAARSAAGGRSRRDVPLHGRGSRTKGRRTTWSKCRPRLSLEHDGRGGRSSTRRLLVDRGSRPAGYGGDGSGAQRPRGGPCLVRAQFGRASRGWRADSGPGDSCGRGIRRRQSGWPPPRLQGSQAYFS